MHTTSVLQKLGYGISPFSRWNSDPAAVIWLKLIEAVVAKPAFVAPVPNLRKAFNVVCHSANIISTIFKSSLT